MCSRTKNSAWRRRSERRKELDDFELSVLRQVVHDHFNKNEMPETVPSLSPATMHRMLRKIGFPFKKWSRNALLIEATDMVQWRRKYLRQIAELRRQGRPIFNTDEIGVEQANNGGPSVEKRQCVCFSRTGWAAWKRRGPRYETTSPPGAKSMARGRGRHIYTDGSYTSLSSGAAYVIMDGGVRIEAAERFKVLGATSAYCVELVAFSEAIAYVCRNRSSSPTYIYTDCLSLLQALKNPDSLDPRIDTIRRKICRAVRTQDVSWPHGPGDRTAPCTRRAIKAVSTRTSLISGRGTGANTAMTRSFKWAPDVRNIPQFFPPDKKLTTLLTGHARQVSILLLPIRPAARAAVPVRTDVRQYRPLFRSLHYDARPRR
ncbi:hypothetical protein HPB50_012755 [Hyalomma asiaticum]|uniref:Uncharacterized protein n=1 Tax=Hyalomma asiaticum TaxID=266040 RepID=A0ACB7T0P9_HYAAI|nr:hypothetical protein HPB50_012755 [Hyalomma asiaticum]